MTNRISHAETHEAWSAAQLAAFRTMNNHDRLGAVKSGALDHWADEDRDAALDMLGQTGQPANARKVPQALKFEPARKPLPFRATRASRFDRTLAAAATGWIVIMIAVAGRAHGLY